MESGPGLLGLAAHSQGLGLYPKSTGSPGQGLQQESNMIWLELVLVRPWLQQREQITLQVPFGALSMSGNSWVSVHPGVSPLIPPGGLQNLS